MPYGLRVGGTKALIVRCSWAASCQRSCCTRPRTGLWGCGEAVQPTVRFRCHSGVCRDAAAWLGLRPGYVTTDRLVAYSRPSMILPVCETQLKQLDAAMAGRQPAAQPDRNGHGSMLVHAIPSDPAAWPGCGR